ncbi:unnamed protein product, partial [Didymodactylos carnosus]
MISTYGTKNANLVEAIVHHRCERKPGIRELTEKKVIFDDGSEEVVDLIVCCTGFRNEFQFLDTVDKEADPTHAKIVCKVGKEARISHDLYKHCIHPDTGSELFFVGFVRPAFGAIPPLSEMQARWCALLCSNKVKLPDKETIVRQCKQYVDYLESQFTPYRTDRIVTLVDHVAYSDDISRSIGCRPNMIKLFFTEPYIWIKCMCGPMMNAQYRLVGPHNKPEQARQVLREAKWIKHINLLFLFMLNFYALFWFCGLESCKPPT